MPLNVPWSSEKSSPKPISGPSRGATEGPNTLVHHVETQSPYKQQKANMNASFEEKYARLMLKEYKGNVSAAARQAGIDRMSLHKILSRYNLDPQQLAREE